MPRRIEHDVDAPEAEASTRPVAPATQAIAKQAATSAKTAAQPRPVIETMARAPLAKAAAPPRPAIEAVERAEAAPMAPPVPAAEPMAAAGAEAAGAEPAGAEMVGAEAAGAETAETETDGEDAAKGALEAAEAAAAAELEAGLLALGVAVVEHDDTLKVLVRRAATALARAVTS